MKPVRFLHPAEQELIDAARFYAARAAGLGQDFLDITHAAAQSIGESPERFPTIRGRFRRRLVRRFPYALIYRAEPDEIVIVAVAHLHRRPDYWLNR